MKYFISIFFISLIMGSFSECKKAKVPCGCDAPLMDTINNAGNLYYDSFAKDYTILSPGGIDGTYNDICDTNSAELRTFLDSVRIHEAVIRFSGQRRMACLSDTIFYIGKRTNINITRITYY